MTVAENVVCYSDETQQIDDKFGVDIEENSCRAVMLLMKFYGMRRGILSYWTTTW